MFRLTCSACVWLPEYVASISVPRVISYWKPAEYCHTYGIERPGSLKLMLSPACVARPRLDPGAAAKPLGNGFESTRIAWPSTLLTSALVVCAKPVLPPKSTVGRYDRPKPPRKTSGRRSRTL